MLRPDDEPRDPSMVFSEMSSCLKREIASVLHIYVRQAVTGEIVAEVQARSTDTIARLCEATVQQTGRHGSAQRIILGDQVLSQMMTLEEAGLEDGSTVSLARTGLRCLTAGYDGTAHLWEVVSQRSLISQQENSVLTESSTLKVTPGGRLSDASISPCGKVLLTLSNGTDGRLWNTETGRLVAPLQGGATLAKFSPDGQLLVGVGEDGFGRIWNATTGECLHKLQPIVTEEEDISIADFSPDGQQVLTCCGHQVMLWDVQTGAPSLNSLEGHSGPVRAAAFSPDGTMLLTASEDGTAHLWSTDENRCLQVLVNHGDPLVAAVFSPRGGQALTACTDGSLHVWSLQYGALTSPSSSFSSLCSSNLSSSSASSSPRSVFGYESFASLDFVLQVDRGIVSAASFSPDGSRILVVSGSEELQLYSAYDGDLLLTLGSPDKAGSHQDWVRTASFGPDGLLVASGAYDGSVRVWSVVTGECLQAFQGHQEAVVAVTIAPA